MDLTDNSELKKSKATKGEKAAKSEMPAIGEKSAKGFKVEKADARDEEEEMSDDDPFGMEGDSSGSDSEDDGLTDAR